MALFKKRKLIVDILIIYASIFLITIFSIIFFSFTESRSALIKLGSQIIENQNQAVIEKLDDFLRPTSVINIATYLMSDNELDPHDMASLASFMHTMLQSNPQVVSVYLADVHGNLFIENHISQPEILSRNIPYFKSMPIPQGSTFLSEIFSRQGNDTSLMVRFKNNKGKLISAFEINKIDFDARTSSWFKASTPLKDQFWLGIYKFFGQNNPIVTISFPIRLDVENQLVGVAAVDVAMSSIGEQLKKIALSNKSSLFIVNNQAEIITSKAPIKSNQQPERLPHISEINYPLWQLAYKIHSQEKQSKFTFTYDHVTYIAHFTPYALSANNQWQIASIMPINNFVGGLNVTNNRVILFSLAMLLLGLVFIIIFAHKISRPITQLAEETKDIIDLNFTKKILINTEIQEIQAMIDSLNAAKNALSSFAKYIPKNLVTQLLQNKLIAELGGQEKNITVLFTDITNFTKISEQLDPEYLMIHVSEYLDALTQCIHQHSGNIDKYIGDAIMAFWGAPLPDEKHVQHACEAVLACREVVNQLNIRWKKMHKPVLRTRFGLSSGKAIVGNMGSADRLNYTMIGDTVNLAARFENLNKNYHTEIIVSESVFTQCHRYFLFRPLDIVTVRGKVQPTRIYELIASLNTASRFQATHLQIQFCDHFRLGFDYYHQGDFEAALYAFLDAERLMPNDSITGIYIQRCHESLNPSKT